jgi:hypothetical protein
LRNPIRRLRIATATSKATARMAAGKKPATNRAPTDSVVTEPRSSMATDGGTVSAIAADTARTAANSVDG